MSSLTLTRECAPQPVPSTSTTGFCVSFFSFSRPPWPGRNSRSMASILQVPRPQPAVRKHVPPAVKACTVASSALQRATALLLNVEPQLLHRRRSRRCVCSNTSPSGNNNALMPHYDKKGVVSSVLSTHPGTLSLYVRRAITPRSSTVSTTFDSRISAHGRGAGHDSSRVSSSITGAGIGTTVGAAVPLLAGAAVSTLGLASSLVGVAVATTTSRCRPAAQQEHTNACIYSR
jgi:hypothetical protein